MLGIPHALNVLSNIPFLVVGLYGLRVVRSLELPDNHGAWTAFFVGVALVSGGSAWYHWSPGNSSLVWDRLPMTVGFMGLLVALCREYLPNPLLRYALLPAVFIGIGSVFVWQQTDDLRFYLWVQFMPLGLIVLLMLLYPPRYTHGYLLGTALALYALAKVAEYYDAYIFLRLGNLVSGHSLKHLLAAAGCFLLIIFLRQREPTAVSQPATRLQNRTTADE